MEKQVKIVQVNVAWVQRFSQPIADWMSSQMSVNALTTTQNGLWNLFTKRFLSYH